MFEKPNLASEPREEYGSQPEPYRPRLGAGADRNMDLEDPTRGSDSPVHGEYGHPDKPRPALHRFTNRIIPFLPIFLAFLFGIALTAGTTYALVIHVRHIVNTATVSSDPAIWSQKARTHGYDRCYNGCSGADDSDCADDPDFVANACDRTAEAGTACDAALMWNWREGRYPEECLVAVGEIYRDKALAALRRKRRGQYGLVVLTIFGGLVVGWVTYKLGRRAVASWDERRRQPPRTKRAGNAWPRSHGQRRDGKESGSAGRPSSFKTIFTGFLCFGSRAHAFACTGYGVAQYQYFVNSNGTISGVVEGWMSNCYHYQVCTDVCSQSCSTSSSGSVSCHQTCSTSCTTHTRADKQPQFYVSRAANKVIDCGFELIDTIQEDVGLRVANAGIEKNYWVRISVNGYNITSRDATDDEVWCLHKIGDTQP